MTSMGDVFDDGFSMSTLVSLTWHGICTAGLRHYIQESIFPFLLSACCPRLQSVYQSLSIVPLASLSVLTTVSIC